MKVAHFTFSLIMKIIVISILLFLMHTLTTIQKSGGSYLLRNSGMVMISYLYLKEKSI